MDTNEHEGFLREFRELARMEFEFAVIGEIRVKSLPGSCLLVFIRGWFGKQKRPGRWSEALAFIPGWNER
jgi:hypothetical protein